MNRIFSGIMLTLLLIAMFNLSFNIQQTESSKPESPWPMFQHDPQHTGRSPFAGPQTPDIIWRFVTDGRIYPSCPTIGADSTIYTGSSDKNLYAINSDGSLRWKFNVDGQISLAPAIGNDGTIYVGTDHNYFYAISHDGNLKWKFNLCPKCTYYSSPTIGKDGTIYVSSWSEWSGHLVALNPNGTIEWSISGTWYGTGGTSSPAIGIDGTIYVGSVGYDGYYLYAINPNGSVRWNFPTGSHIKSSPSIGSDGTIYVISNDGYLYAINQDGDLRWKFSMGSGDYCYSSPAIGADGTIYVCSAIDGNLYALNRDGSLKWEFPKEFSSAFSPAIDNNGTIYVCSIDGKINALNSDETLKWNFTTEQGSLSSLAIDADGTLYVGANRSLYAVKSIVVPPPTPDFSMTASPTSLTIQQGDSDTSVITITSIGGFNQSVQLTVSGAPSGVTTTLSPEQVTPPPDGSTTSTLTVSVDTTATPGSYTLTVTGTSGALTHSVDISLETTVPENQPPDTPTFLFQYELDGPEIPVGGTISGNAVTLIGVVSDPDTDRVKLQIELRRLDEYDGNFIGVPTHESEFVESDYGVMINITGLILGDYHWQARTVDEPGATSDWVSFPQQPIYPPNPESEADFTIELTFQPPYEFGDTDIFKTELLKGKAHFEPTVQPSTGKGAIKVDVSAFGAGSAMGAAWFILGGSWRSDFSATVCLSASFNLTGHIDTIIATSEPLVPAGSFIDVQVVAKFWITDETTAQEIPIGEKILFEKKTDWRDFVPNPFPYPWGPLPSETKQVTYEDAQAIMQGLIDLQEGHEYSWRFEIRIIVPEVTAVSFAFADVIGYLSAELVDVRVGQPVLRAEPELVVASENVMYAAVGSPVDVLVVDPVGKRVGFDFASQLEVNEIPGAWYSGHGTDPQLIRIPTPVIGDYEILLAGTGIGNYTFAIIGLGNLTGVYAFTGEIAQNEVCYYSASISETAEIIAAPPTLYTFLIVWGEETFMVSVESNSTVSNFAFNQPSKEIGFNVTGEDGTIGSCNVTIPKALLYGEPWTVLIDGAPVPPTITENATHSCLYFTYTHRIQIIGTWVIAPPPPPLSVSISPLSASILVGQSVTFTSTVSGGFAPYSYQWYLNDAPVSGATSDTWAFTPTTSGIYYVYLRVTDDMGNITQSEIARITVTTVPVGGYSVPIQLPTTAKPVISYIALLTILTAILRKIKRKTKRKH